MMRQARLIEKILTECVVEHDWRRPLQGLRRIVAGRDLTGLVEAAEYHEVTGCVYYSLKGLPDVDVQTIEELEARHQRGMATHLRALGDLAYLHSILEPTRTSWLVVRGPVLPELIYRRPDLRTYSDLDIVVAGEAFPHALTTLERADAQPMSESWRRIPQEMEGEVLLVLRYGTTIRLRWHLFKGAAGGESLAIPMGDILARARQVSLNGVQVATLDEADTLVYLATLASMQGNGRLGWLKDIEQAITTEAPPWEAVIGRAHAWGTGDLVRASLREARDVVAAPVPDDALRALAVTPPGRGHEAIAPHPRAPAGTPQDSAGPLLLQLLSLERRPLSPLDPSTWQAVLRLAMRERVAPLLLEALPDPSEQQVPETVRAIVAHAYQETARDAGVAYRQLADVLLALRSRGMEPVVLKGAALARATYRDPARRPFSDLDLLVKIEDVDAIHHVLRELGYAIAGDAPTIADRAWRHGRGYYDPRGQRLPIDIHWRYSGYPNLLRLEYMGVLARARETAFDGGRGLVPSPGDMVVASSVYFLRELWYGKAKLRYLRDVAEVVYRHVVDWAQVLRVTQEDPLVRSPLHLALGAAAQLLGAPVPAAIEDALRPRRWPAAARSLRARICRNLMRREHPREALLEVALMRWLDGDSLAGYARWMKGLVVVPRPLAPSQRRWLRRLL